MQCGREHDRGVVGDGEAGAVGDPGLEAAGDEFGAQTAHEIALGLGEGDHQVGDHPQQMMDLGGMGQHRFQQLRMAEDQGGVVQGPLQVRKPDRIAAAHPLDEEP